MVDVNMVFSPVAFFIFMRETLEASVIVAVLLQCMNRTMPRLKRWVWWGAFAGIATSIVCGGIFAAVYYVAKSKLFQGTGKFIFQGCISYIACILITYLGFAMLRFANMEQKVARKLDAAAEKALGPEADAAGARKHKWSVFFLAFTAVLREGIESIVFLAGVGSQTAWTALPLACFAGLVVGLAIGAIVYYGGKSIRDLRIFFAVSTFVLFFIAAGQVSLGTQLLSFAGAFGPYAAWTDELSWQYRPVADLTYCCNDNNEGGNQFWVLMRAMFGFQARPTPMILILYVTYWVAVIVALVWKWRNGSLFDADYKRKRTALRLRRQLKSAERKLAGSQKKLAAATAAGDAAAVAQLTQRVEQQTAAVASKREALEAEESRLAAEDEAALRRMGLTPTPEEDSMEMAAAVGNAELATVNKDVDTPGDTLRVVAGDGTSADSASSGSGAGADQSPSKKNGRRGLKGWLGKGQ